MPPFPAKTFTWKKDAAFYEKRAGSLRSWIVAVHDVILERELSGDATLPYYHLALRDFLDNTRKALAVHHEHDSDHDSDYDSDYDYDKPPPPPPLPPRPSSPDTACCATAYGGASMGPGTPERGSSRSRSPEEGHGGHGDALPNTSPKAMALEDRLDMLRSKIDVATQADDPLRDGGDKGGGGDGASGGIMGGSMIVAGLFDRSASDRRVDLDFHSGKAKTKKGGFLSNRLKQIERIFSETTDAISGEFSFRQRRHTASGTSSTLRTSYHQHIVPLETNTIAAASFAPPPILRHHFPTSFSSNPHDSAPGLPLPVKTT